MLRESRRFNATHFVHTARCLRTPQLSHVRWHDTATDAINVTLKATDCVVRCPCFACAYSTDALEAVLCEVSTVH
jgi:hypothetical protein